MKNKLSIILLPVLAAGLLTGCGRGDEERDIDLTKTQLKVAAIRSGIEDAWLQDLAGRFMKKYENYSFEPGKTGIQVWVDGDKTAYNGDQLLSKIANDDHQVYVVENVKYNQFINPERLVVNLKDIINVKGSDGNQFYTEEKSILDRMDPQFRAAFEKSNGDIYMLPYYESFASFQYDRDVFNNVKGSNGKSFYLKRSNLVSSELQTSYYADAKNPGDVVPLYDGIVDETFAQLPADDFFCDANEDASHRNLGPDGIEGTFDDGLPQTFAEFAILLKYMEHYQFKPILGNSTYNYYFSDMLASVWANEEGIDNMNLNFTWNGTANDLVKIENGHIVRNGDELVTESKVISDYASAKELHRQEGVYRALEFAKIIADSNPSRNYAFTDAQDMLISTKDNTTHGYNFGLLCDGNWWENESKGTFADEPTDKNYRLNRNFSFFTFPKSSSSKWDETRGDMTFYNINSSTVFLNKTLETSASNVMEAAKAFFYYINSNEGMSAFTTSTSITRPFEYTITESDSKKIAPYGKDMMKLRSYFSDKTGKTKGYSNCTTYPLSELVSKNEDAVHKYNWNFQTADYSKDGALPVDVMVKNSSVTPESYFIDSYNYIKQIN